MKKLIVCTLCPNGCEIEAEYTDRSDISVSGNRCERGYEYAVNECFDPRRTFTGSVDIAGGHRRRIPVRSTGSIPRDMMRPCADLLREIHLQPPVEAGYVVLENVMDSGIDIVTTISMEEEI